MSKKTVAFTGLAALVAGVVIGSSGTEQAAVAEPKIKTVTQTKTVTKEVTPQGCLDAIDASEAIMGEQMPKFTDVALGYVDLVQAALQAGMDMDVSAASDIGDRMGDLAVDTRNITRDMKPLIRDFKIGRADCEAS